MELVFSEDNLMERKKTQLSDENGQLLYWGIYDFAYKYRTRIYDHNDNEIAYVEKDIASSDTPVFFYDPLDKVIGNIFRKKDGCSSGPEGYEIKEDDVVIEVEGLMRKENGRLIIYDEEKVLKCLMIMFGMIEIKRQ